MTESETNGLMYKLPSFVFYILALALLAKVEKLNQKRNLQSKFKIMKRLSECVIMIMFLSVTSCNGNTESVNSQERDAPEEKLSISPEPLKNPCELLSSSEIESIDGFEESSEGSLHKASGETYKQCDFSVDNRQLGIIFRRLNQKEIDLKKLESNFEYYLKQDAYSEVQNTPGDQAIYSSRKTETPSGVSYSYLLQLRYGNHTERQIGLSYLNDEQEPDVILKRLVEIANKLEE